MRAAAESPDVIGQYLGIGLLALFSVLLGAAFAAVGSDWIRYLGLAPLALGVHGLASIARGHQENESPASATQGILAVTLVTLSSGADNVSVYTPVFAKLDVGGLLVAALVFAIMTGIWCVGARALVNHPRFGTPLRHRGRLIASMAMAVVGLLVLLGN